MQRTLCSFCLVVLGCLTIFSTSLGCLLDDPYDPQTWISKLDDTQKERDEAITKLQQLEDAGSIPALGKAWETHGRSPRVLGVIIELAAPIDTFEYIHGKERPYQRPANFEAAAPFLQGALERVEESDGNTIDNAVRAANALADGAEYLDSSKSAVAQALINVAQRRFRIASKAQPARVAAIQALGHFGKESRVVDALIKVLEEDQESGDRRVVGMQAAAINALAMTKSEEAIVPLLRVLFQRGVLFQQSRRALVAIGEAAKQQVFRVFKGTHTDINNLATKLKFNVNCGQAQGPGTECQQPAQLQYKSAALLGDFVATEAVPSLVAELAKPSKPAFFIGGNPGPSHHVAVLEALQKINDSSTAQALQNYIAVAPASVKPRAIEVYSFVARSTNALGDFSKLMVSSADQNVRISAGNAYARLATKQSHMQTIYGLVKKYRTEAKKWDKKAKPLIAEFDEAKKEFDAYELTFAKEDTAFQKLAQSFTDLNEIYKGLSAEEKAEAKAEYDRINAEYTTGRPAFESRQKKRNVMLDRLEKAENKKREPQTKARTFLSSQRTFEMNLARVYARLQCSDAACFAKLLDKEPKELLSDLGKYIDDGDVWKESEKSSLYQAMAERSLVEIAKSGKAASAVLETLLGDKAEGSARNKHIKSTKRIVRQAMLLAIVKIAPRPCEVCVTVLDKVVNDQRGQSTLKALTADTRVVASYFTWAK